MSVMTNLKDKLERAGKITPTDAGVSSGCSEELTREKVAIPAEVVSTQQQKLTLSGEGAALARFQDHFVSVEGGSTFVYQETTDPEFGTPTLNRMTIKAFKELHANETVITALGERPIADVWFKHQRRRTYTGGVKLLPNMAAPTDSYNLWRGMGYEPDPAATVEDALLALWHLKYVICDGDQVAYRYLLGWMARAVQRPEKQGEVAVVMIGGRGTGKGTLGNWFTSLFGSHGLHIQNANHLVGQFNGHLRNALGIFLDEAVFVGDRRGNNVLKSLITEDRITVEAKYADPVTARNRLKIMMATNEGHAIPAGIDERRFFVTHVSDRKKQDHAYFGELNSWWETGGNRAFLKLLQRIDLSDFNIRKVPRTRALDDQKLASLSGLDAWLYERLQGDEDSWEGQRRNTAATFATRFSSYCEQKGGRYRYENTSPDAVGKALRRWLDVERKRGSSPGRKWILELPDLDEARRQFAEKLNVRIDWDV